MRQFRKTITMVLALVMILSLSNVAMAANFWDIKNHWANSYINWAADVTKLVDGYPDGSFEPEGKITKAEFYKMINRLAGFKEKATINFTDVGAYDWFYDEVAIGVKAGYLTNGYTSLSPNSAISRDEAARIVAYSYLLTGNAASANRFTDTYNISNRDAVGALVDARILNGYPDGSFRPYDSITRGEFSKVLYTAVNNLGMPEIYKINTGKVPVTPTNPTDVNKVEWDALRSAVKDGNYYLGRQSYYRPTQGEIDELKAAVTAGQAMLDGKSVGYSDITNRRFNGFAEFYSLNRNSFKDEAEAKRFWDSYGYYGSDGYYHLRDSYINYNYHRGFNNFDEFYNHYKNTYSYNEIVNMWNSGGYNKVNYTRDDIVRATTRIRTAIKNYTDDSIGYNDRYSVTFNTMGGSSVPTQTVNRGYRATAPYSPTRAGYRFEGWYTDSSYRYVYDFNSAVNSNITLYAKWSYGPPAPTTYRVSFNSAGGSYVSSQTVTSGRYAYAPTTPTRTGYSFVSWVDEGGYVFDFNRTPITRDRSLTAKWVASDLRVTFDLNGGSGSIPTQTVAYGGRASRPTDPTKVGYDFKGWTLDNRTYNFTDSVTRSITLRATWAAKIMTVNFNSDGGTEVPSKTVEYNKAVSAPTAPTKEGHTFGGWLLNGVDYDFSKPVTGNITLVAKWIPISYTVTFNTGEDGSAVADTTVKYGEKVNKPADPTKTGYTFVKWLNGTTEYDFAAAVKGNLTLTAEWKINEYTVTFDVNGGSAVDPKKVEYNKTVAEPTAPTKEGYTFEGWYDGDVKYDFNTKVTKDVTLKAKWKTTTPTVDELSKVRAFLDAVKTLPLTTEINAYTTQAEVDDAQALLNKAITLYEGLTAESQARNDVTTNFGYVETKQAALDKVVVAP